MAFQAQLLQLYLLMLQVCLLIGALLLQLLMLLLCLHLILLFLLAKLPLQMPLLLLTCLFLQLFFLVAASGCCFFFRCSYWLVFCIRSVFVCATRSVRCSISMSMSNAIAIACRLKARRKMLPTEPLTSPSICGCLSLII